MTDNEINENNVLLAKFAGFMNNGLLGEFDYPENEPWLTICASKNKGWKNIYFPTGYGMKFHEDWNWIMAIVNKIVNQMKGYDENIYTKRVLESLSTCNINEVYNACILFINEYNNRI